MPQNSQRIERGLLCLVATHTRRLRMNWQKAPRRGFGAFCIARVIVRDVPTWFVRDSNGTDHLGIWIIQFLLTNLTASQA